MNFASFKRAMAVELPIRLLAAHDADVYKALRDDMLARFPDAFTSDASADLAKPASSYLSRFQSPGGDPARFTIGAWLGERLAGAISCERDDRLKVRHIGHIIGMMVRPEAQGQGIGRTLLRECIAQARGVRELEMLTLSVTSTNAAAIGLYESAGFVRYARLPHAIKVGNTYFDKDQMMLSLP
jgi:ribosomal protein S18 acetylase RimI-like enzyme